MKVQRIAVSIKNYKQAILKKNENFYKMMIHRTVLITGIETLGPLCDLYMINEKGFN